MEYKVCPGKVLLFQEKWLLVMRHIIHSQLRHIFCWLSPMYCPQFSEQTPSPHKTIFVHNVYYSLYYCNANCCNTCTSPRVLVTGLWNGFVCCQLSTMSSSSSSSLTRLMYWCCPWSSWSWWIFWLGSCCHSDNSSASCGYKILSSTQYTEALLNVLICLNTLCGHFL